jgi:hypothetical protein
LFSKQTRKDLVDLINSLGANWNRKTHYLFPRAFRERIWTFVLCNRVLRRDGAPWLPRDPLDIVIKMIATDDLCQVVCNCCSLYVSHVVLVQEDQQIEETKAILSLTYQALSNKELIARCKQVDRDAALQRKQK